VRERAAAVIGHDRPDGRRRVGRNCGGARVFRPASELSVHGWNGRE
jgi:hypothetical protein